MQKLIAKISRNKNLVLAIMLLLIMSMSTMLLFWDADVSSQKISITHFGSHQEDNSGHSSDFSDWEKVVEDIQDGQTFFVLDEDAKITHIDPKFAEIMKYNTQDIENQEFFPLVHQNDLPELMVSLIKVLQSGESVANIGPYRIKTNNPESDDYHFFIGTIIPINDENQKTKELVVIHKDITNDVPSGEKDKESNSPKYAIKKIPSKHEKSFKINHLIPPPTACTRTN